MIEHRSSPSVCHLTLNLAVTVALCHISLLICCCVPPSVSGPPSLILLLLVPLKGCLSHMSIWSPQRVANPTPYSFFYLLSYQSPPCLPPQLFFSDRMEPPNVQDSPQALVKKHVQLLVQFLGQSPKFLHHTRVQSSHLTQRLSTWC